jgi:hypothetical protein
MNVVGILIVSLVSGLLAAGVNLSSGGSLWTALLNYLGIGMLATVVGVTVVIWRAWEAERPSHKMALGGVTSISK